MPTTSVCFNRPFTKLKWFLRSNSTGKTISSTIHRVVVVDVSLAFCASSWVSYAKWVRQANQQSTRTHTDFLIFRASLQIVVTLIRGESNFDMIFSPYTTHTPFLSSTHPLVQECGECKILKWLGASLADKSPTPPHLETQTYTSSLPICLLFLIVMWESHWGSMLWLFKILMNILIVIMTFRQ